MTIPPQRISDKMIKDLKSAGLERINKGLTDPYNKRDTSMRELTELATKTSHWKGVMEELRTKPKRK